MALHPTIALARRGRLPEFLAAAFALALARGAAAATPTKFVDCNCLIVGPYVLPAPPVPALPASGLTGVSPGGRFSVSAVPGSVQGAAITVIRNADDAVVVNHLEAADWGFSPDDDRLVVAVKSVGGAPALVSLYDLTTVPATKLHESTPAAAGSAISFSPHGVWFLDVELSPTPSSVILQVFDAQTGLQVFQDSFNFTAAPGLPQDQLGAVAAGFGPDSADRTLTYAYITGATSSQWTAVNLETGLRVVNQQPGAAFLWGFSPCGDVIGIVNDHEPGAIKSAEVYATLELALHLGVSPDFPATDDASLSVDVNNHLVTHNLTTEVLAANTAAASCPTPPPNTSPTAAFSAPASNLSLSPVVFTDHSADPDGRVVSWAWSFGDGQFSSLRNPTHVFLAGGAFSVQLTVTDNGGATDSVTHSVAVTTNQPPHAAFTFTPILPSSRDLVTLTDHSTDPDDGVASLDWSIDGVAFSGSVVQARACPPSMTASLTASDHGGQFDTLTQVIPVATGSADVHLAAGGDLAAAFAGACPGDRLVLDAGHYTGGVTVPATISIKGAGMGATFIDGAGSDPQGWVLRVGPASRNTPPAMISDVTLGGGTGGILFLGNGSLNGVEIALNGASGGIFINDQVFAVNISGSNIHDNQGSGLAMSCCADISVDHSAIARNGGSGVSLAEANSLSFVANDVLDNVAAAFAVQVSAGPSGQLRQVLLSRFVGNGGGVFMDTEMLFAGNLVARNAGDAIVGGHPDQIVVLDSTVADNTGVGIEAGMSAWNTIVAGNAPDLGGTLAGDHNLIGGTPGFFGLGDYHLAPGSPAIDTGDNTRVPVALTTDADGDPRILNGGGGAATVDIGWDEALTGAQGADGGADAGAADAGVSDAGVSDAGVSDAGVSDAGVSDAGVSDAGLPGSDGGGVVAVGGPGSGGAPGCGCRNTSSAGDVGWIGAVAWLLHRRKLRKAGCATARP